MTVTSANLMVGPGRLRWAPVGTDDSLIVAAPTPTWTGWNDVGMTDGGLAMSIAKNYATHSVDQAADWVASTITERHFVIQTSLAESGKIANLSLVNNGGVTASPNASWQKYEPNTDLIATQETYIAVAVEGNTLGGKKAIVVVRKVLNVESIAFDFKKDGKTMFGLSFAGHYVSDTTPPFAMYTQN